MLKTLCELGVFLQGFKLKCPRCSSISWYHLREVGSKVNCKGCLEDFNMPIESSFSYRLNDLIKNNIFQSKTQRDGNLTVIRTLISLNLRRGYHSFEYSPQINLYDDHHSKKPANEIDIVALVDGKLVVGEAKHDSKEFSSNSHKSLNSLIEVCDAIFPDKVILSCYKDEHSRLDNAKKYLEHHFRKWDFAPEIETLLLHQPDYFNLGGARYFYY
jgi:predicted transposase YbfD/YdcC